MEQYNYANDALQQSQLYTAQQGINRQQVNAVQLMMLQQRCIGDPLPTTQQTSKLNVKTKEKKEKNMIREYLNKHRDTVFTLTFALLIDQFVLGGALRQRIQRVVEAALSRIEKTFTPAGRRQ